MNCCSWNYCQRQLSALRIESSYLPVAAAGVGLFVCLIGTGANGGNPQCFEMPDARELQLKRLQGNSLLLSIFALVFWLMLKAGLQSNAPKSTVSSSRDILGAQNAALQNQRVLVAQQATTYLLLAVVPATALTIFMSADIGVCLTSDIRLSVYGLLAALSADMLMRHVIYPFGHTSQSVKFQSNQSGRNRPQMSRFQGTGTIVVSAWGVPTCLCIVFSIPPLLSTFVDSRVGDAWLLISVTCCAVYGIGLALSTASSSPSCPWLSFITVPSFQCGKSCAMVCKRIQLRYSLVRLTSAQRADGVAQWRSSLAILVILTASLFALLCYELVIDFKCAFETLSARRRGGRASSLDYGPEQVATQISCEGGNSDDFFGAERIAVIVQSVIFFCFLIQLVFMVVWERIFLKLAIATHKEQAQQTTAMLRWLSHECRSPVAAAMLSMDYILQDCLPEVAALLFEKEKRTESAGDSLFGYASKPVPALSPTSSPSSAAQQSKVLGHKSHGPAQEVLLKVHAALLDLKSSMDLVVQPLTSLSQVLDNMLLYMRRRSTVAMMHNKDRKLDNELNPLAAWKTAWQNASASHDIEGVRQPHTSMQLSVNTSPSLPLFIAEGPNAVQELLAFCMCSSTATQATLLQVLTNYLTNAMKYGKRTSDGRCDIQIAVSLLSSRSVLRSHPSPKSRKRPSVTKLKQGSSAKVGAASAASREPSFDDSFGPGRGMPARNSHLSASSESQSSDKYTCLTSSETLTLTAVANAARAAAAVPATVLSEGLKVTTATDEPGVLLVSVQDWGRGMSPTDLLSLFQPFSRLRSGAALKGNGLGLWLMKELVETQGAKVSASSPGQGLGCSFSVFLPIKADFLRIWQQCQNYTSPKLSVSQTPTNGMSARPASQADHSSGGTSCEVSDESKFTPSRAASRQLDGSEPGRLKILVVDDSPANRSMMVRQLKRKGFAVDAAEDGTEGLEVALMAMKSRPYDLVISDMTMPAMNGDELARELFQIIQQEQAGDEESHHRGPIFIGVTGNTMQEDITLFLEAGAHRVLSKPASVKQVMDCFEAVRSELGYI